MGPSVIDVPVTVLLTTELLPSAKLLWMIARLDPGLLPRSGLSRPTVQKGLAQLQSWHPPEGPTVLMPTAVLLDQRLGAQARILYALLLLTPGFSHPCGHFTYDELADLGGLNRKTVVRAVEELRKAEWIQIQRLNRRDRLHFDLTFPGFERGMTALAKAQTRLERAKHRGEGLMREYLSLLIDVDEFEDDVFPWFLVNPRTEERLQFDRFYPPAVAFEFQGAQHFHATEKFTEAQSTQQRERDLIKIGLCVLRGITLVHVLDGDLTLEGMQRKVGRLLPLRDLTDYDLLIDFLETESMDHRRRVARFS